MTQKSTLTIAEEVWREFSAKTGVTRFINLSPAQRKAFWVEVNSRKESHHAGTNA